MNGSGFLKFRALTAAFALVFVVGSEWAMPASASAWPWSTKQKTEPVCAKQNSAPVEISRTLAHVQSVAENIPQENNFNVRLHSPHDVQIIDEGHAALEKRIQMIRSAKHSIDLETFIFGSDLSSRIILNELAIRAREGVKVRVLIDMQGAGPRLKGRKGIASTLSELGIDFKFFNGTPLWLNFKKANFRTHRKLLVIDGQSANGQVIMGGRNIGDDYFGMSTEHNFSDRDVYLRGKVAEVAHGSFGEFWNSNYSQPAPKRFHSDSLNQDPEEIRLTSEEYKLRDRVRQIGAEQLAHAPIHKANDVSFISDKPGREISDRVVAPMLWKEMLGAKKNITIENYTYIKTKESEAVMKEVARKEIPTTVSTNARYHGGPRMLNGMMISDERQLVKQGIKVVGRDYQAPRDEQIADPRAQQTKWTAHSKTLNADNDTYIGSSNFDPRSQDINAETGVIIHNNPAVANQSRGAILKRAQIQGAPLKANGQFDAPPEKTLQRGLGRRSLDKFFHVLVSPIRRQL